MLAYYEEVYKQDQADALYIIVKMKKELMEYVRKNGGDFDENENLITTGLTEGKITHIQIRMQRLQILLDFIASSENLIFSFVSSVKKRMESLETENQELLRELNTIKLEFSEYKLSQCYSECPRICNLIRQHHINPKRESTRNLSILQFQNQFPNLL